MADKYGAWLPVANAAVYDSAKARNGANQATTDAYLAAQIQYLTVRLQTSEAARIRFEVALKGAKTNLNRSNRKLAATQTRLKRIERSLSWRALNKVNRQRARLKKTAPAASARPGN